ncbi:MAG: putative oxidoreductase [Ilumatobacteraceae bacterium]|nr:putative oxidoreductase [Ilumatobacteraceae bacterium]
MLAQLQRTFGGPDAFVIEQVADPVPAAGELLISVGACGLNRLDLLQREAPLVRGFSLPHIAGMDVAGVVVGHGPGVGDGAPPIGASVLVDPVSTCGVCDRCIGGHAPYCENLRTIGSTSPGGFAELVAVPSANAHLMPDGMSFIEAAAIPVPYITAWHALMVAGAVQAGETVLVNAAGSAVSTAIIQLAKVAGATVIGTMRGAGRRDLALAIGCDWVIDHDADDIAEAVMRITDGRGVQLAVDHVGPALFDATIRSLAVEGRMVFCGTTTGIEVVLQLPAVYHWGRRLIGSGGYQAAEFDDLLAVVAGSGITPVIDSVWPFARLAEAQQRMFDGGFFGRLIVEMQPSDQAG